MAISHPRVQSITPDHRAIISNEYWYGDGPPCLSDAFSREKTERRHRQITKIIQRASKRARKHKDPIKSQALHIVGRKLEGCAPTTRCGSLACPQCARALQRAKAYGQKRCIHKLNKSRSRKTLVMATVIPLWMQYQPSDLDRLNIPQANDWLKAKLAEEGFNRVMIGSPDISLMEGYYQLHWHIAMWTSNPKRLSERLKRIFPSNQEYARPVHLAEAYDLTWLF